MAKINYDGTNIVGGPFKPYVDEQVKVRQEKLGNSNKTSEEIVWENGKSAFVALASSVNVENGLVPAIKDEFTPTTPTGEVIVFEQGQGAKATLPEGSTLSEGSTFLFPDLFSSNIEYIENTDGEERIKLLDLGGDPQQYFENFLARNIVLYGGTSHYNPSSDGSLTGPNYRFGITENNNVFDDSAYGFGGTNPDGFKPMPGITSFNLKSKNMGSLRDATVTLRANSEEQFKMIDNLYCRIGYTMFLEWGNSLYFDNEGRYQKYDYSTSMIPMFLSGKIIEDGVEVDLTKNPTNFISRIEAQRKESNGNYDAFFGRVKNFSWQYIAKGGYWEISLSLISWGDIIESLTIDGQYGTNTDNPENNTINPNNSSALSTFLTIAAEPNRNLKDIKDLGFRVESTRTIDVNTTPTKNTLVANITEENGTAFGGFLEFTDEENSLKYSSPGDTSYGLIYDRLSTSVGKIISGHAQFADKHYYYVRFGDILDFIKDRLLIYNNEGNNEPILDIDTNTDKNLMYVTGINISADPSKVMVKADLPYSIPSLENLAQEDTIIDQIFNNPDWVYDVKTDKIFGDTPINSLEDWNSTEDPNDKSQSFPLHGKIMNIYFEYQYLLDTIGGLRDEETTKISLYDFVDKLLKTANSCLGGVNKLSIRLEGDRVMRIYDQNPIYGTQVSDNEGATINLYGIKPTTNSSGSRVGTEGSFVTEVNIKTELTNDFSTVVSVGAQSQGQVVGEDATGLSKWNFGLVDRYYPIKIDSLRKNNNNLELTTQERIIKLQNQLKYLWLGYSEGEITTLQRSGRTDTLSEGDIFNGNSGFKEDDSLSGRLKRLVSDSANTPTVANLNNLYYFEHFPTKRLPDFVKLQKDWLVELIKLENEKSNAVKKSNGSSTFGTNQIGMIPINIQVTMDGLSGIRIYDRLKVDTRFLPNYYPQTLYWVIKGVSHEIVNNKWNTKLETIAVPKLPDSEDLLSLFPTKTSGGLLDSTENQYAPAQNIFSTPSSLSSFAASVNSALGSTYSDSIKASVVFLAQQEQNLQGFNYNYYGVQTDLKWSGIEPYINGSFNSKEGEAGQGDRTANARWFASFKTEADGIKFVAGKLNSKGWGNIEDDRILNSQAASEKYFGSWLFGNPNSPKVQELLEKDANKGNKKQELWDASLEAINTTSNTNTSNTNSGNNRATSSINTNSSNSSNTFLDSGSFGTGTPIISDEDLENLFL